MLADGLLERYAFFQEVFMNKKFFLASIAWLVFLGWIVYNADMGTLSRYMAQFYNYRYGDKVGHFILMGSLALLLNLSFPGLQFHFWKRRLPGAGILAAIPITLEECSQIFFKTRTFSLFDLSADYLGIALIGTVLFLLIRKLINQPDKGNTFQTGL
jgi:polysaccharide biosynthesis protein VpsQ